jgi:hypothetical protein
MRLLNAVMEKKVNDDSFAAAIGANRDDRAELGCRGWRLLEESHVKWWLEGLLMVRVFPWAYRISSAKSPTSCIVGIVEGRVVPE